MVRSRVRLFPLLFLLSRLAVGAEPQDVFNNVDRIVAVGDVHGDLDQFKTILKFAGVIDEAGNWAAGKTHLVQTGDVLDRWADSRRVMDLLMSLEKQAQEAGGMVHPLLGNHEAMNLYGDLRYTVPGEFTAYQSPQSKNIVEAFWQEHVKEMKAKTPSFEPDEAYRKKWEESKPPGFWEQRVGLGPDGLYGKWLRTHNTVVRINGILFMHGGIGPNYLRMSIRDINNRVRAELNDFTKLQGGAVMDSDGPLWFRGLATTEESVLRDYVDEMLSTFSAKRIVISHTRTPGAIVPRFRGKVIMIDVGLSRGYGGPPACLVVEKNKLYTVHRGERFEIPTGGSAEVIRYLKRIAELEPPDSELRKTVSNLETGR